MVEPFYRYLIENQEVIDCVHSYNFEVQTLAEAVRYLREDMKSPKRKTNEEQEEVPSPHKKDIYLTRKDGSRQETCK